MTIQYLCCIFTTSNKEINKIKKLEIMKTLNKQQVIDFVKSEIENGNSNRYALSWEWRCWS